MIDKLVDECIETVEEMKPAIITLCCSCTVYTVLFWTFFTINIDKIGAGFVYFYWYLKKDALHVDFNTFKETTIY